MVNEVKLLVDRHRNVVVLRHGVVTRGSVTSFAVESLFKTVGDCWPASIVLTFPGWSRHTLLLSPDVVDTQTLFSPTPRSSPPSLILSPRCCLALILSIISLFLSLTLGIDDGVLKEMY